MDRVLRYPRDAAARDVVHTTTTVIVALRDSIDRSLRAPLVPPDALAVRNAV